MTAPLAWILGMWMAAMAVIFFCLFWGARRQRKAHQLRMEESDRKDKELDEWMLRRLATLQAQLDRRDVELQGPTIH